MRALFVAAPGVGHLLPLVPTAWAMRCARHEVLVASTGPSLDMAVRSGLPAVEVSDGTATDAYNRLCAFTISDAQLKGNPTQRWEVFCAMATKPQSIDWSTPFGEIAVLISEVSKRMVSGIIGVARSWRADVLVYEPLVGAGMLAAAETGIPAVLHGIGMPYPTLMLKSDKMPDKPLGIPTTSREPAATIDLCPPSLRPSATKQGWPCRYVPSNGGAVLPDWLLAPSAPRRICVTLGSMLPTLHVGQLIDIILEAIAIARADAEVVVAGCAPMDHRSLPVTVRIADWVPLNALLPTCQAIIHHGGAGTTFTALYYGVPQVVLPYTVDQSVNAGAVVARGLGVALSPSSADRVSVASHLDHLLTNPATRNAAAEVAAEIATMPGPEDIVRRLSTLVRHDSDAKPNELGSLTGT
jgi:Protein of unknown function (DUF1205)